MIRRHNVLVQITGLEAAYEVIEGVEHAVHVGEDIRVEMWREGKEPAPLMALTEGVWSDQNPFGKVSIRFYHMYSDDFTSKPCRITSATAGTIDEDGEWVNDIDVPWGYSTEEVFRVEPFPYSSSLMAEVTEELYGQEAGS